MTGGTRMAALEAIQNSKTTSDAGHKSCVSLTLQMSASNASCMTAPLRALPCNIHPLARCCRPLVPRLTTVTQVLSASSWRKASTAPTSPHGSRTPGTRRAS